MQQAPAKRDERRSFADRRETEVAVRSCVRLFVATAVTAAGYLTGDAVAGEAEVVRTGNIKQPRPTIEVRQQACKETTGRYTTVVKGPGEGGRKLGLLGCGCGVVRRWKHTSVQ
jgi:hypothetical protein